VEADWSRTKTAEMMQKSMVFGMGIQGGGRNGREESEEEQE
jgi:hypothetical protein